MKNLRKTITLLIVIGLLGSFSSSAFSLSSEWIDNEVSQVRLISPFTHNNDQKELILGLQYKMKPGWKTYWQSPGDGGFAQNISWENSTHIEKVEIVYCASRVARTPGSERAGQIGRHWNKLFLGWVRFRCHARHHATDHEHYRSK